MRHIVAFKLQDKTRKQEALTAFSVAYPEIVYAVPGLISFAIQENCFLASQRNFDFLVSLEIADLEAIQAYATHPLHLTLQQQTQGVFSTLGSITLDT